MPGVIHACGMAESQKMLRRLRRILAPSDLLETDVILATQETSAAVLNVYYCIADRFFQELDASASIIQGALMGRCNMHAGNPASCLSHATAPQGEFLAE